MRQMQQANASGSSDHADDESFSRTISDSDVPVFVDFYAAGAGRVR